MTASASIRTDDPLPLPSYESLTIYYDYLSERLGFPFAVQYETCKFCKPSPSRRGKVKSLDSRWSWDEVFGILCMVDDGDKLESVPLTNLSIRRSSPNYSLIDDYTAWFEGELPWTEEDEDAEDDEAEKGGKFPVPADPLEKICNASWLDSLRALVVVAMCAGITTATIGSVVAALNWAAWGAGIGAALLGGYAAWKAHSFGEPKPSSISLRVACRCITVLVGGLVGAMFGAMVVAFVGALAGWAFGYLILRQWGRPENLRLINPISLFLAANGAIGQAYYVDIVQAGRGFLLGLGIGAAAAVLTAVAFIVFVKIMAPRKVPE